MSSLLTTAAAVESTPSDSDFKPRGSRRNNVKALNSMVTAPPSGDSTGRREVRTLTDNAGAGLADFKAPSPMTCDPQRMQAPPPGVDLSSVPRPQSGEISPYPAKTGDAAPTKEGFQNLPSAYSQDYYRRIVPMYSNLNPSQGEASPSSSELLKKLNQIIHLLEEQHDVRTGNVNEELILYCFLGVFTIFVVDSFARAGKYVR